ncbi:Fibrobacter succinogenes major domain (Fib_succ_major) [Elizabethkingia miricola]|nr:Fibrobacter succinogenes major domain (Fib_succ_major) [Elizabethkingia miricola]
MKKELYLIRNTFGISALLFLGSCRSADTDNNLANGGSSAVSFNLLGTEYADSGSLLSQASLGNGSIPNSGNQVQSHNLLITPSNIMIAELSPSADASKVPAQASLGSNSVAAVSGNALGSGAKFRIIAYRQSNGAYHTHQDYTVGQTAVPMMLDNGAAYNIVTYSYGTNTLPAISSEEQNNISSAQVNYDDTNRDFMYQNIAFTPVNANTTLNITLRHRLSQITTIVKLTDVGNMITSISNGLLTPHYNDGAFPLSSGIISGRSTITSGAQLNFPSSGFPGTTETADPVFVNADTGGSATGSFSADVTIGGVTKTVSLPNSFRITPGNKSNLTINLIKCGAYVGANTNIANYKEFMCHNLGADTNANPFSPGAAVQGAKYQWGARTGEYGRYVSQVADQSNTGAVPGWERIGKPDGSWSDTSKTTNDPCPTGYRVPTRAQWQAALDNNNIEKVGGTWAQDNNYTRALYFRTPSGIRTLMLPTAGSRFYNDGGLAERGYRGVYWSSTDIPSTDAYTFDFRQYEEQIYNYPRTLGFPVRCIAE